MAAFVMPWFASQGLLLSGQFLNDFLAQATPADLQRFIPGTSRTEAQALRALVDLFPVCGALAAVLSILLTLGPLEGRTVVTMVLAVSGAVPLAAWAVGITRLPPGSTSEVGLWVIACGALAVLVGALAEFASARRQVRA